MGLGEIWNYPLSKNQVRLGCLLFVGLILLTLPIDWIHVENNYRIGGVLGMCFLALVGTFLGTFLWTQGD